MYFRGDQSIWRALGWRTTISPTPPVGTGVPSSAAIQASQLNTGTPIDSAPEAGSTRAGRVSGVTWVGEAVSVRP